MRCLQVDNTINDLLGINIMSPTAKKERKRKQEQWEDIQTHVVQVRGCSAMWAGAEGGLGFRFVARSLLGW